MFVLRRLERLNYALAKLGQLTKVRKIWASSSNAVPDHHQVIRQIRSTNETPLRPRDIDPGLLRRALEITTNPMMNLRLQFWLSAIYDDLGMRSDARSTFLLAELFAKKHDIVISAEWLPTMVINTANYRRNPATTSQWWSLLQESKAPTTTISYQMALASHLWMQRRFDEAREACLKAQADAAKLPSCGANDVQRDNCANLLLFIEKSAADAKLDAAPSPKQS